MLLAVSGLAAAIAGLAGAAESNVSTEATAAAIRILPAGQPAVSGAEVVGPPAAATDVAGFSYPDDGSILKVGSASGSVAISARRNCERRGTDEVGGVTLFGGEVTVASVSTHAAAAAGAVTASGETSSSRIEGLVVLGQALTATTPAQIPLADWGTLETLVSTTSTKTAGKAPKSATASITGLRIEVIADHGGLPAGSEIDLGVSLASAVEAPDARKPGSKTSGAAGKPSPVARGKHPERPIVEPGSSVLGTPSDLVRSVPTGVQPTLSTGGYVFPVYGPATFGDTFGAPRPDIISGWHHGEDIFAPLGTPLLAVADGTLHTIGWNEIGGWRLWLRDAAGNEFYYAHLSAYSPLTVEGKRSMRETWWASSARAGMPTAVRRPPPFRDPSGRARLGRIRRCHRPYPYPCRVETRPGRFVRTGTRLRHRRERASHGPGRRRPAPCLLQVTDVSSTSGLVPGGLERALRGTAAQGPSSGGQSSALSPPLSRRRRPTGDSGVSMSSGASSSSPAICSSSQWRVRARVHGL